MTTTTTAPGKSMSKAQAAVKLLKRRRGATMAELTQETGWQNHSVRAFLSGLRKRGQTLAKEARKCGETSYHVQSASAPPTVPTPVEAAPADAGAA